MGAAWRWAVFLGVLGKGFEVASLLKTCHPALYVFRGLEQQCSKPYKPWSDVSLVVTGRGCNQTVQEPSM